jgi:hypothetical protein
MLLTQEFPAFMESEGFLLSSQKYVTESFWSQTNPVRSIKYIFIPLFRPSLASKMALYYAIFQSILYGLLMSPIMIYSHTFLDFIAVKILAEI